jgi:hypothetical protein
MREYKAPHSDAGRGTRAVYLGPRIGYGRA